MSENPISFADVCKYVGQLFIESRDKIERLSVVESDLRAKLARAESERDNALSLLTHRKPKS